MVDLKNLYDYCTAKQKKAKKAGKRRKPLVQYIPKDIVLAQYKLSDAHYKLFMSSTKGLEPHEKTTRTTLIKRLHCWLLDTRVRYANKPDRMSLAFIMD